MEDRKLKVQVKMGETEFCSEGNVKDVKQQVNEFYNLYKMMFTCSCEKKTEE